MRPTIQYRAVARVMRSGKDHFPEKFLLSAAVIDMLKVVGFLFAVAWGENPLLSGPKNELSDWDMS